MILELPAITTDNNFFKSYIPDVMKSKLKSIAEGRKEQLEEYISSNIELFVDYNSLIDDIIDSMTIMLDTKKCTYITNNILFIDGKTSLNSLVSLINYGSLDIRGLNIFTKTFDYISNHCSLLLRKYLKK